MFVKLTILVRIKWACKAGVVASVVASATKSNRYWVGSNLWQIFFFSLKVFCFFLLCSVIFSSNIRKVKVLKLD